MGYSPWDRKELNLIEHALVISIFFFPLFGLKLIHMKYQSLVTISSLSHLILTEFFYFLV